MDGRMRVHKSKDIDGEKLRKQILKRGMTLAEMSADIGRSPSYLSRVVNENSILEATMKQLT